MTAINPYLNFNGNTEEAFNFYKSVFGGEFAAFQRFGEMPGCDEMPEDKKITEADKEKVLHVALPIGEGNVLMATDALESMGQTVSPGTNFSVCISPESKDEAERLFSGLAEGGKVGMPLSDMFWGGYFGMLTDKFGIQWMVNFDQNRAS
ncbi:MAG: VOC family protein [Pyrinomonadaceae bacterium]